MGSHICFRGEIKKNIMWIPLLSGPLCILGFDDEDITFESDDRV